MLPTKFGSFGQTVSEKKNLKNQPIRNKNRLWWPCLLMDRDKLSNLYRGPPIDDTCPVLVYLAKQFQRRIFFRNQPIRNKNCLWLPCLLMDRDEMSIHKVINKHANFWWIPIQSLRGIVHTNAQTRRKQHIPPMKWGDIINRFRSKYTQFIWCINKNISIIPFRKNNFIQNKIHYSTGI